MGIVDARRTSPARIAVVIPCYNQGAFVRRAVESALAQEAVDVRAVVVDDGSDDASSRRVVEACAGLAPDRIKTIRQANAGLPAARNRGAAESTGEFLVFLDADDWIRPEFSRKLVQAIDSAADASVSHAYCQEELAELGTGVWRVPEWDPLLLMITNLHPVTCLVRRTCFEQAGGFDESMRDGYEDWDLWLKFLERSWRGVRVREPLFVWRRHSRETMVMRVLKDHEALYRRIVANHEGLYAAHGRELLVLSNVLMRKFDVNWLDETGYPIPLRELERVRREHEAMLAAGAAASATPRARSGLLRRWLGRER